MTKRAAQNLAAFPADLKLNNRIQILDFFKNGGAYTANHIADQIGVSRQTVMKAIQFFMEKGLLVSSGKAESTNVGGKRPELFTLSPEKYLMCISLWPDQLNITLLNFRFDTIEARAIREPLSKNLESVMKLVGETSRELLQNNHITPELLYCVNISTSGIIDYEANTLKYNSLIPEWGSNLPIPKYLRPYFAETTPILLENVAKVVGRSILYQQKIQGKRMLTLFSSWGGVCACFIENGRILNGRNSLIGEIGHMVLVPDDPELCGCGSRGCFERLVSNERIRQSVAQDLPHHPTSALNKIALTEITVETLFTLSEQGDTYARRLVSRLARYFAMALRNITLIFDPETVVFQGEYAMADAWFCDEFQRFLREFQYYPPEGSFILHLDRQPIQALDVCGGHMQMLDYLFSDSRLYE
ncbi:MAG: ROK family transcriptional regulator [Lachnospiraceae bacterium]|nr:ROK family transcriptional regulator [Lachnospiraceae bacterium]